MFCGGILLDWVKYQQQREQESKDFIDNFLKKWYEEEHIKKIARQEAEKQAKLYLDRHKTEVQIEIDRKSLFEAKKAIYDLF